MMKTALLLLASALVMSGAHADTMFDPAESEGWHWYNVQPDDEMEEVLQPAPAAPPMSPVERMEHLQRETKAALATAIMEPTVDNFARFKRLQDFWTTQASEFSMVAQKTMLVHPELDYNLQHSHYNGTAKLQQAADQAQQQDAIAQIAARYGVFLFYRGGEAIDMQMAETVKGFAQQYGISFIPVSVDGRTSPTLPQTRINSGQAERLGVTNFPALVLVDPKEGTARPLAWGFISQDDLAKRFLYVATDFKPNF